MAYDFQGIALNTPPNINDVPQWDGTKWIPVPLVAATPAWSAVLAAG